MSRPSADKPKRRKNLEPKIRLSWEGRTEPAPLPRLELVPVDGSLAVHTNDDDSPPIWRNALIHGDNLQAMAALESGHFVEHLAEAGGISLIYIDPPYAMEAEHRMEAENGASRDQRGEFAFSDSWGGAERYLQFMYERLLPMRRLLADDGIICVHCDWRANSWLRVLMDEVFGRERFRNEVVWRRAPNLGNQAAAKQLGRVVDTILVYSKTPGCEFRGRAPMRSQAVELTSTGRPRGAKWDAERKLWFTTAPRGDYTDASIRALRAQGRVHETPSGKVYIKYPLRRGEDGLWYKDQPVDTLWTDDAVKPLRHCTRQELDIGYPTQKPEGLLTRIIEWTTREGDIVADFFCGSGTTLAVATELGRPWIGCDIGDVAVRTAAARLRKAVKGRCGGFEVLRVRAASVEPQRETLGTCRAGITNGPV